jgi:hypothetical protein
MKLKTNYFSLLLLFVIMASGIALAQSPANNSTGISATTSFTFVSATTEADQWLQISTVNTFTTSVLFKDLGAVGTTSYTFSASDLQGALAGHTQFNNNTTYYWRILSADQSTVTEPAGFYTFKTVLGPPTGATATLITSTSFSANWTANAKGGATAYILKVGTTSGGTDIVNNVNVGNVLTHSVTGLTPNHTYYYSVEATDGTNTTASSNEISATTLLGPPTATAATSIASTSFSANWTANATGGATAYILRVGTTSGGTDIVNDVNVGNVLTHSVTGLSATTTYYYSVKATDGTNTTIASNEITATTQNSLAAPVASSASSVTAASFSANWAASSGATSYILRVGTTSGGTDVVNDVNIGNVLTYSVSGLTQSTNYYYSVKAFDGSITSISSNQITVTTISAAGVPLVGPVNGLTGVSVLPTFSWSDVFNETTFTVKISTDSAAFDSHVIATKVTAQNATSYATADTDSGLPLSNGTKYYWQVSVQGGSSNGAVSQIYHFTTTQDFTLNLSTPENNGTVYTSPAKFSWYLNTPQSNIQFIVQYKESATPPADFTFWKDAVSLAPTTSLSDSATVVYGKTYYWRVIAQRTASPNDVIYDRNVYSVFSTAGGSSVVLYPSWPLGGSTIYTNIPQLSWYPSQYTVGLTYQVRYSTVSTVDVNGMLSDVSATSLPLDANIALATSNLYESLPALTPGTLYYWQVRAYYSSTTTYSNWSSVASFVTNGAGTLVVPVVSYPIVGETVYTTNPTLYWYLNAASSGLYYDVDLSTDSTFASHITGYPVTTLIADQMSYDATGLVPGQTYFWRVRSNNGTSSSAWSESTPVVNGKFTVAGGTTSHPVASWPIGTTPPIVYTTQPTLNWYQEGSGLGITQYVVKYIKGSAPSDWTSYSPGGNNSNGGVYTVTPTTFSVQDTTNLTYGATYYWAVASYNGSAYSAWSQGPFTVVGGSAGAAIVLSQPDNGATVYNTSDTLSWYINGSKFGLLGYELKISQSDVHTPLVHDYTGIIGDDTVITGLTNGATYYWSVGAIYSDTTFWSSWYSFTVNNGSPSIVQPIIGSPNNVEISTASPVLSWVLPAPSATGTTYELLVSSDANFTSPKTYSSSSSFVQLDGLTVGTSYFWKVKSVDSKGTTSSYYSGTGEFKVSSVTAVQENKPVIPREFSVSQNYPNPFNPSTIIEYALPKSSLVTIKIYNILGQEVKTLMNSQLQAGTYSVRWNGDNNFGQHVSTGTYIYRVTAGANVKTMKMILLK